MLGCPSPCPPDPGVPPTTIPVASRNYTTGIFPQPNTATNNGDLLAAVNFAVNNMGKTMLIPTPVNWNDGINQANYDSQRDFYVALGNYIEGVGGKTYYAVDFWGDENRTFLAGLPAALGAPQDFSNPNVCPQMIGWLTDLAASTPA
ncbi:MAG: hypothetical protein K8I02_08955, partial [Candidatus Methylomirabilis sp.]|nr:hypothetical protein [Deltaproteobacteria bacterium]